MRALALALLISVLVTPAHAQSLQINGKFGYLGEYEFSLQSARKPPAQSTNSRAL